MNSAHLIIVLTFEAEQTNQILLRPRQAHHLGATMVSISARYPAAAASPGATEPTRGKSTERTVGRSTSEALRLRRRQLSHDIRHELGTITMLASLLSSAPDIGQES